MVDWKKPESTSPSGEGEDCRVQAMTSFSLCAHGWPLVDNQFQSWHLRTTCSAQRGRGKKNWSEWVCGERNLTCIKLHLKFKKRSKSLSPSTGFSTRKIYFCVWLCYVQLSHGILWSHCGWWCFNILQFLQHLKLFFIYIKSIFINLVKTEVFLLLFTFTAYNPSMSSRG